MSDIISSTGVGTARVRAQHFVDHDRLYVVNLTGVQHYSWHEILGHYPPFTICNDGKQRTWGKSDNLGGGVVRARQEPWRLLYDIDNGDGDPVAAEARNALSDSFVMLRLANDDPNSSEHDDVLVAVERHQLVTIQEDAA